jgi:hypothetical protein
MHPIGSKAEVIAVLDDVSKGKAFMITPIDGTQHSELPKTMLGFGLNRQPWSIDVSVPIWSLILAFAGISSLPWLPIFRRYSLRTMLVATTVVAIAFGAIAALSR